MFGTLARTARTSGSGIMAATMQHGGRVATANPSNDSKAAKRSKVRSTYNSMSYCT